jgi:hypothetical protein
MKHSILTIIILCIFIINFSKIPSYSEHISRNKYNVIPIGILRHINSNNYIDENGVIWVKRGFLRSLLHNPFKYYVFETYDVNKQSSSEVQILKTDFDSGVQKFKTSSFNYYSSFNSPVSHFFADVVPIIIYLRPKYKIYN